MKTPDIFFPQFQRAPTLGGECYEIARTLRNKYGIDPFQRAPTLGGECYLGLQSPRDPETLSFNGHPPGGVNATELKTRAKLALSTLVSMGTHPWG